MTSLPMTRRNLVGALRQLGWAGTDPKAELSEFQRGWNLGPALTVDGVNGPLTREAIRRSLLQLRSGKPTASASFSYAEFRCQCGGRERGCQLVRVHRQLLVDLEGYRRRVGGPVQIVSGYRCPVHNAKAGGAANSQHLYGAAADLDYRLSWQAVARLRLFAGIGRSKRSGLVRHVDVRHVSGHNNGGTPDRPVIWDYAA